MASLTLKGIYRRYPDGVTAVNDFNLDIEDKESIVLAGPSGCGKTTVLRMIAGLEEISEGELRIGDALANNLPPKDRNVAMVPQHYALYPHMTVFENMAFGLKLRKVPKPKIRHRVEEAADILDIGHLLNRRPKALSGGQQQRVALGRALVREPKVFLLDEPLSNLDARLRAQTRIELYKLHKRLGATFVYVTHDQAEAMTMGDRIVVMKDGLIQQVNTPRFLYEKPCNMFVAGFIGVPPMNFIEVTLEKDAAGYSLHFDAFSIALPASKNPDNILGQYAGKSVVLGIRPENIHEGAAPSAKHPDGVIAAEVEVTEQMGAETYLYLNCAGNQLTARVSPASAVRAGDIIRVAFDVEKIHLFDRKTEQAIEN